MARTLQDTRRVIGRVNGLLGAALHTLFLFVYLAIWQVRRRGHFTGISVLKPGPPVALQAPSASMGNRGMHVRESNCPGCCACPSRSGRYSN